MEQEEEPTKKTPYHETIKELAEAGDIIGITEVIDTCGFGILQNLTLKHLKLAFSNYDGPMDKLIEIVFKSMLKNDASLLVKAQLVSSTLLHKDEQKMVHADEPLSMKTREWLERVERLENRFVYLSEKYGKMRHVLSLGNRTLHAHNVLNIDEAHKARKAANQ
jgi:hypothetical protein